MKADWLHERQLFRGPKFYTLDDHCGQSKAQATGWPLLPSAAATARIPECPAALHLKPMHKPKPYRCSICGQEVPNLPMAVFGHQLSHVGRRPWARDRAEYSQAPRTSDETE